MVLLGSNRPPLNTQSLKTGHFAHRVRGCLQLFGFRVVRVVGQYDVEMKGFTGHGESDLMGQGESVSSH
jgi:hypothetical protein